MVTQPAPSYRNAHRATSGTICSAPAIALTTRDANRPQTPAVEQKPQRTHRSHRPTERREQEAVGSKRVAMLTKLLTLKFGPLSSEHERVISEASAEQLEQYVERVVRAARLDDVFAE